MQGTKATVADEHFNIRNGLVVLTQIPALLVIA